MFTGNVTVFDIEMSYFSFGNGKKPLIILPGLGIRSILISAKAIENAYKAFAEEYTIYVFDRRSNTPQGYSVQDMADDTAAVMRELGISGAYIFGASQGGMIAMCMAIRSPELVRAVVLGSTSAYLDEKSANGIKRWIELAQKRDITGLTLSFIDNLYSPETVGKFRELLMHMNDGVSEDDIRRFIILAQSLLSFDIRNELRMISCPSLVIGCRGDKLISAACSEQIAEASGSELYMYGEEYGHCVFDEAPDYKQRMAEFFGKV